MRILGIGGLDHNGSVTLVDGEQILSLVETERLVRQKNVGITSAVLLNTTLDVLNVESVDHVALADATFVARNPWLTDCLSARFPRAIQSVFLHHDCHAAAAFYASGWDAAAVASVDGKGDGLSATMGQASRSAGVQLDVRVPSSSSLGRLWWAASVCCQLGDHFAAGKTMAWAAYGEPRLLPVLRRHLVLAGDGSFRLDPQGGPESLFRQVPLLADWLRAQDGTSREEGSGAVHADVAASVQALTEEVLEHLVGSLVRRTGYRRVCLSGGVALNGLANQRLLSRHVVDELYVPPLPDDRGLSLGAAALAAAHAGHPIHPLSGTLTPYLGLSPAADALVAAEGFHEQQVRDPIEPVARMLSEGKVVAWCAGREEIGPRALGNRSILASPTSLQMRDHLNRSVKQREPFRPFGCSLPLELKDDWLNMDGESPYMLRIVPVRYECRDRIPAVVHRDGTTRPHTVTTSSHPELHRLLYRLRELGHPPVLLNTSLNRRGEPIAHGGADAMAIAAAAALDAVVIGSRLFLRAGPG